MTHTPGPWTVAVGQDALVKCPDGRSFNIGDAIYHADNVANARLIAAAPEMLALLVELKASHYGAAVREEYEDRVSAAIAKAEGRP